MHHWLHTYGRAALCITSLLLFAGSAAGQEDGAGEPFVETHGFVSQGFIKTTENNYLAQSERGSFEFTEVGINFTKQLTDKLRAGVQLFAQDLGPLGNYSPKFDWFYLDYSFWDWLGIRVGRTKLPFGLYNETQDVDVARIPILLPQSLYRVQSREFLLAQSGAELYGYIPLGGAGAAEYRAWAGTIFLDASSAPQFSEFTVPYLFGGRLMWQLPLPGLRLGVSAQRLRLDFDFEATEEDLQGLQQRGTLPEELPPNFDNTITVRIPATLWIASIEYQVGDLLLAAEYGRTHSDIRLIADRIPESRAPSTTEGYYAMASYRVTNWFSPGLYYSVYKPSLGQRGGLRHSYQHDAALTFRYDLNAHWLLKLEGHYMVGTAGLSSALNDDAPLQALTKNWGVFLAKTTAYF